MRVGGWVGGVLAMTAMLGAGVLPSDAFGLAIETITVNTTADHTLAEDPSACDPEEPGGEICPLRAAAELASDNATRGAQAIEIVVPGGHYRLSKGSLPLGNAFAHACFEGLPCPVTLAGAGAGVTVLEGDTQREVTAVEHAHPITIEGVTMQGGDDTAGGALNARSGEGVTLRHAVLTKNDGHAGGAIYVSSDSVTAIESVISENVSESGGAVYASAGGFEALRSTLQGNMSIGPGGAIHLSTAAATLVDSTIASNGVTGGGAEFGGAIAGEGAGTLIKLKYTTLAGNHAPIGGGISGFESLQLEDSILSGDAGGECSGAGSAEAIGTNIVFGSSSCLFVGPTPLGVDPLLGPLLMNGGFAPTLALGRGSPAVNLGGASCASAGALDERGVARPEGAACDLGAFEAASDAAVTLSASPQPAAAGSTLSLTTTAADLGSEAITGVSTTITLPSSVSFESAPAGCVLTVGSPTTVTCPAGSLGQGQAHASTVLVRPERAGALLDTASVSIEQPDYNPANDSLTVASAVNNPPVGAGGGGGGGAAAVTASALLGRTFKLDRHGNITLHVTCPSRAASSCRDRIALYASRGQLPAVAATRARLLAAAGASIPGGATATIRIHLPPLAIRALARRAPLPARVLLTDNESTRMVTHAYGVTIKPFKASHHR